MSGMVPCPQAPYSAAPCRRMLEPLLFVHQPLQLFMPLSRFWFSVKHYRNDLAVWMSLLPVLILLLLGSTLVAPIAGLCLYLFVLNLAVFESLFSMSNFANDVSQHACATMFFSGRLARLTCTFLCASYPCITTTAWLIAMSIAPTCVI